MGNDTPFKTMGPYLLHQVKNITKLKDLDQDSSHFWGFQMVLLLETQTCFWWKKGNDLFCGLGFFIEQFRGWRCFWCISGKFWGNLLDHLSYHLDPFGSSTLTLVEQQRYQTFSRKLSLRNCFKKSSTYVDLIQKNTIFQMQKVFWLSHPNEWVRRVSPFTVLVFFSSPSTNSFAVAFFLVSRASVKVLVPLKMRREGNKTRHGNCPGLGRRGMKGWDGKWTMKSCLTCCLGMGAVPMVRKDSHNWGIIPSSLSMIEF